MKKIITAFILLALSIFVHAQQPSLKWAYKIAGDSLASYQPSVYGSSIGIDSLSNVYTLGRISDGKVDFDHGTDSSFLETPINQSYLFIMKNDALGNFLWVDSILAFRSIGFNVINITNVAPIATDDTGNVYITGMFTGTIDFDPGIAIQNFSSVNGGDFILKINHDGNLVWAKQLNANNISMNGITVDKKGNVCITGMFEDNADDFDPGPAVYNLPVPGSASAFILKLDNAGNFKWAKGIGGANYTRGYGITTDDAGSVYTTGGFPFTADFDPGPGTFNLTATDHFGMPTNYQDAYVCKLDSAGNFKWAKRIGGAWQDDGVSLTVDKTGNTYATGSFYGDIDFTPATSSLSLSSNGGLDFYITKIDPSGNFVWIKNIGSSSDDQVNTIIIDKQTDLYLLGTFNAVCDFDPGANTFNLTATAGTDIFISKLDTAANFIWSKNIGGTDYPSSNEALGGIAVDTSFNIFCTGTFDGTADFDPAATVYNLHAVGYPPPPQSPAFAYNFFLLKWAQCTPPSVPLNNTVATNLSVCNGNSTTLTVSGTGVIGWYSAATGGSYLGSGNSFTTPVLNTATTFYVQDSTCSSSNGRLAILVTVNQPTVSSLSATACSSYTVNGQTYTVTGNYTQVLSNAAGCDSTISLNLTINNAVAVSQAINICAGEVFVVGPNSYNSSGVYTDVFIAANGCDSTVTTNLVVQQLIDTSINQNGNTLISNNSSASYQWVDCDNGSIQLAGQTNQSFTPIADGNYAVILHEGICVDTSNCINVVRPSNSILIYPNPSAGIFNVEIANLTGKTDLMIYNSAGALLFRKINIDAVNIINISNLANGVYILKLVKDKEVIAIKEIVKGK